MIIPNSPTQSRTRSPPPQATRGEPTTSRDNREVGISRLIPSSGLVDNVSTHKTPEIRRWLLRLPRFHLHFTPTYSSWMSLVERWFAELTNKWLRRGTHRSIREPEAAIRTWIDNWNEDPKPFVWHKSAEAILDTLAAYCERISDSGH